MTTTKSLGSFPLVTFALFAYNQEKYIREAVEGAFSQTYSPLEIILSDDSSNDRTFEIMSEMAEKYVGPHRIILNRNKANLGIGMHINRLNELASGKLIVIAAGDDISLPQRTKTLFTKWQESPDRIHLVYSGCEKIYNDGSRVSMNLCPTPILDAVESFIKRDEVVLGAVCAWTPACFERFGPLNEKIHNEDAVIPFRAMLLGGIAFAPEALVKYRVFAGTTVQNLGQKLSIKRFWNFGNSLRQNVAFNLRNLRTTLGILEQKKQDLLTLGNYSRYCEILAARESEIADKVYLTTGSSMIKKITILFKPASDKWMLIKYFTKGELIKLIDLFPNKNSQLIGKRE